jgi:hypothetical protein
LGWPQAGDIGARRPRGDVAGSGGGARRVFCTFWQQNLNVPTNVPIDVPIRVVPKAGLGDESCYFARLRASHALPTA